MQCSFKSLRSVLCVLLRVTYFKDHLLDKFLIVLHKAYVVILIYIYTHIHTENCLLYGYLLMLTNSHLFYCLQEDIPRQLYYICLYVVHITGAYVLK